MWLEENAIYIVVFVVVFFALMLLGYMSSRNPINRDSGLSYWDDEDYWEDSDYK